MNLSTIDAAIEAYRGTLPEADMRRLAFFRGIWEIQARSAERAGAAHPVDVPDASALEARYWAGEPLLAHAPAHVDATLLAQTCVEIARYLAQDAGLDAQDVADLARTDWDALVAASDLALAGSDPQAFLEGLGDVPDVVRMVFSLALRPQVEPAQQAYMTALDAPLRAGYETHDKPLRCPVCGGAATVSCVGPTPMSAGNARRLSCTQCGCTWDFERVRCARCGTRMQGKLHYLSLEGDDAHRMHCCDACGGYTRTFFVKPGNAAAYVPEVEDVVMARLDAAAASRA